MKRKISIEEFNPNGRYTSARASIIRLKGQWLQKLGFAGGQKIELSVIAPGVLEIRLTGGAQ